MIQHTFSPLHSAIPSQHNNAKKKLLELYIPRSYFFAINYIRIDPQSLDVLIQLDRFHNAHCKPSGFAAKKRCFYHFCRNLPTCLHVYDSFPISPALTLLDTFSPELCGCVDFSHHLTSPRSSVLAPCHYLSIPNGGCAAPMGVICLILI